MDYLGINTKNYFSTMEDFFSKIAVIFFKFSWINAFIYLIHCSIIGGSAHKGRIIGSRYYLGNHIGGLENTLKEVSKRIYILNKVHGQTVIPIIFMGFILMHLGGYH